MLFYLHDSARSFVMFWIVLNWCDCIGELDYVQIGVIFYVIDVVTISYIVSQT